MTFLDFESNSLVVNLVLFGIAGVVIWFAGIRLSRYADAISDKTRLGQVFVGMILLSAATTQPELVTTVTAISIGNPDLALNNLFGGIVLQTAILAIADFVIGRKALTRTVPNDQVLIQGALLVVLLAVALVAMSVGEIFTLFSIGFWSIALLGVYIGSVYISYQYPKEQHWEPVVGGDDEDLHPKQEEQEESLSLRRLFMLFAAASAVIMVTGFILSNAADAIAMQSGLGASFIGATLLAASTSLPELSTAVGAARMGNYTMAISNIFGSNAIMLLLVFVSDVFYRQGPILQEAGQTAMIGTAMGIMVTGIYIVGMFERKNRTILRMGIDSVLVLLIYVSNVALLYRLNIPAA